MNSLPPQVWFSLLSSGPILLYNPEILRLVSHAVRNAVNKAFASPGFWRTYMTSCYPNLARRIPRNIYSAFGTIDARVQENEMWKVYTYTARQMFATLCFVANSQSDRYVCRFHFTSSPFYVMNRRCVFVNKNDKLRLEWDYAYAGLKWSLHSFGSNFQVGHVLTNGSSSFSELLTLYNIPHSYNVQSKELEIRIHRYSADDFYDHAVPLFSCLRPCKAFS